MSFDGVAAAGWLCPVVGAGLAAGCGAGAVGGAEWVAGAGSAGAAAVWVCERVAGRGRGKGVRADRGVGEGSLAFGVLA